MSQLMVSDLFKAKSVFTSRLNEFFASNFGMSARLKSHRSEVDSQAMTGRASEVTVIFELLANGTAIQFSIIVMADTNGYRVAVSTASTEFGNQFLRTQHKHEHEDVGSVIIEVLFRVRRTIAFSAWWLPYSWHRIEGEGNFELPKMNSVQDWSRAQGVIPWDEFSSPHPRLYGLQRLKKMELTDTQLEEICRPNLTAANVLPFPVTSW